jgi:hypothetical protein
MAEVVVTGPFERSGALEAGRTEAAPAI